MDIKAKIIHEMLGVVEIVEDKLFELAEKIKEQATENLNRDIDDNDCKEWFEAGRSLGAAETLEKLKDLTDSLKEFLGGHYDPLKSESEGEEK